MLGARLPQQQTEGTGSCCMPNVYAKQPTPTPLPLAHHDDDGNASVQHGIIHARAPPIARQHQAKD